MIEPETIAQWDELGEKQPTYARVGEVDLVAIRYGEQVSVFFGRCLHRGSLLADGHVEGANLICGVHGWDYRLDTGVSSYNNEEALKKFTTRISETGGVQVDRAEISAWAGDHPQPYDPEEYQGLYYDFHGGPEETHYKYISHLARNGLSKWGHHGKVSAMGIPRDRLPRWEDVQIITAQLATRPLMDDEPVDATCVIGPRAAKPLTLEMPLFVSDMSFGALSAEAKVALSTGAEMAGTGICSGEGGMLPEERAANSRYFYELASGMFGWNIANVEGCGAFHFKAGQGAKTGTGGHLPGYKVSEQIAAVRGLEPGKPAVSPPAFPNLKTPADFRTVASEVRDFTGGIPVGFKMSAQHIEADIDFALESDVDYIILDGRGGGTGAAPEIFKENISVPTMAALARARRHLDRSERGDVTLVITGGLRVESDFVKALALGADAVAVANSALQAIGCLGMRACHTDNCPVGVASQKQNLRERLVIHASAKRLSNFLSATVDLMKVLARACGHDKLNGFTPSDLTTFNRDIRELTGIAWAGIGE